VSLSPDAIEGYDNYPPKVRQILDAGLALTKQNLTYTYGSADPANGGMDCSGFIYYILKENGFPDVPRDSSGQYVWVRKAKSLYAVLSRKEDSFEFDDLKPGDLLFWRGTYTDEPDFSSCFKRFASNSRSRRFFVIAMARWISSLASASLPIFISRSPRTLEKRW